MGGPPERPTFLGKWFHQWPGPPDLRLDLRNLLDQSRVSGRDVEPPELSALVTGGGWVQDRVAASPPSAELASG